MNKAFTRESDYDPSLDVIARPRETLPPGVKNYITPSGAARIRAELRELAERTRPQLLEHIAEMRRSGREQEPAYAESRRSLGEVEAQISWLTERIAGFEVVHPAAQGSDRVRFGASVTILDEHGDERTWHIVGLDEADPAAGRVSWLSPIARGLMSREVGDEVSIELPRGRTALEVLAIEYRTPDLADD